MSISDNIKKIRETYDLTQSQLGKIAGVSDKAVWTWENGTAEPRMGAIQKIADHFGITKSEIIEDHDTNQKIKSVRIPVLGEIVAGIPIDAYQEILDWEEITPELAATGDFFALKVKGDSMSPRIAAGDVVIIKQQSDVESGDIAVVFVNGDTATLKKVLKRENGIMLVAFNPAVYEPRFFTNKEVEELPIVIAGKVIELRAKF